MARGCKVERDVDTGSASEGWLGYDLHPFVDVDGGGGGGVVTEGRGARGGHACMFGYGVEYCKKAMKSMGLYYRKDDEKA